MATKKDRESGLDDEEGEQETEAVDSLAKHFS